MEELPSQIEKLIKRASELIDYFTLNRIDNTNAEHLQAAQNAVCAQVEYWVNIDESVDIIGPLNKFRIGSFGIDGKLNVLAPRAKRFLLSQGLLYRGIRI